MALTSNNRSRNRTLYIRLNDEEYNLFEKQRSMTNLNKTDFIVQLLKKGEIKVYNFLPELQEIIYEIKKQGVNLNQIARSLNQNPYINMNESFKSVHFDYEKISNQLLTFFNTIHNL